MNEHGGNYVQWNKPGLERQILHEVIYKWNLKKKVSLTEKIDTVLVTRVWRQEYGKVLVKEYKA